MKGINDLEDTNRKKAKRKKIFVISAVIGGIILMIGVTYAWLTLTIEGTKKISMMAGPLEVRIDNESDNVELGTVLPTQDSEGLQGKAYTFELINDTNYPVNYKIYLETDEESLAACKQEHSGTCEAISDKDIRYEFIENGLQTIDNLDQASDRILTTGSIRGKTTYNYSLRIWLDIDAGNDVVGKYFFGKIKVYAEQEAGKVDVVNEPVLANNLIPVVYEPTGNKWEKADTKTKWYDYEKQQWANAVVVSEASRTKYQEAVPGTSIDMGDILQMYVWIPRYSYTIKSEDGTHYYGKGGESTANPGEIDVQFITKKMKDTGSAKYIGETPSGWYTPPGFTFGKEELPGIWVGKFETGYSGATTTGQAQADTVATDKVIIKPDVYSWRSIRVSTLDLVSRGMVSEGNIYGFDNTYDSHAMKNSEWALISYLTQSKYGKYGNDDYQGANKEVYMNNYNAYKTGCSSGLPTASSSGTCAHQYNDGLEGRGASSTGTIYGIYDINGGAWEYMMGNYNGYSGYSSKYYDADTAASMGRTDGQAVGVWNSGYTGKTGFDNETFTGRSWPDSKYYDLYTTSNTSTACNGKSCKGHALNEVAGWYGDCSSMVSTLNPWSVRGGRAESGAIAGAFSFNDDNGNAYIFSFRVVLAP